MLKEQEKIERYLNGEMSSSEKDAFEQEIKDNKDLSEQVALSKDLEAFFKTRNVGLEQTLSDLGNEFFDEDNPQNITPNSDTDKPIANAARFVIPLLLLLFVSIAGVWYFNNDADAEKFEDAHYAPETSVKETEKMINEGMQEQGDPEKEGEIMPEIIEPSPEIPVKDEKPKGIPEATEKPEAEKPMAALEEDKANFEKNAVLESLIRENIRSNEVITVKMPTENYTFKPKNGVTTLKFKIVTTETEPIELIIYDNRIDSFEKNYPILSTILQKKSNDELVFNANVQLEKGLYYYILRKKNTTEIIYISKFFVR